MVSKIDGIQLGIIYIFTEKKNKWTVDNFCLISQSPDKLFARDLLEFELLLLQKLCYKEKYKLSATASNRTGMGKGMNLEALITCRNVSWLCSTYFNYHLIKINPR